MKIFITFNLHVLLGRKKLRKKGGVGALQRVLVDCDGDTLLYVVQQTAPACHTGGETCFFRRYTGRWSLESALT